MSSPEIPSAKRGWSPRGRHLVLSVMAIGVVYGDIGTSPLYAVRESFSGHFGVAPTPANILGILSLITWALILIVALKYVSFLTRVDNGGEGGVLALTALVEAKLEDEQAAGRKRKRRGGAFVVVGLFGAALLFGDAILTPAISVTSGIEGLAVAQPNLARFVLPLAVAVIAGLFVFQRRGTAGVGKIFGPVMIVWFVVLAVLGIRGILMAPQILWALNPMYGLVFLASNGTLGVLALGAVFLAVTGAEALYADLGHFGRKPIRTVFFILVFPCLLINYFGQCALVLTNPAAVSAPFFLLAPEGWGLPLTALATLAAVIASQAVITGVYSLALQTTQLGYWPRINIRHTSATEFGQIYVPPVNALLALSTIAVVIAFGSSAALAAAYGVAIICTMLVDTILLFIVAQQRLGWSRGHTWLYLGAFMAIELTFLAANVLKIHEGGWLPLLIAFGLLVASLSWRRGRDYLAARIAPGLEPIEKFIAALPARGVVRVPGVAVYMTRDNRVAPTGLVRAAEHFKALHEKVVLLTVKVERLPRVRASQRVFVEPASGGFVRVTARYGYMEQPNIPAMLEKAGESGVTIDLARTTYFLGRERLLTGTRPFFSRAWVAVYSFLDRNSQRAWAFYRIPHDRVVEIGSQFEV